MSRVLPCLLCGIEDHDVAIGLVEIPEPERRVVDVRVLVNSDGRDLTTVQQVRERYAAEPRCRDTAACRRRVATIETARIAALRAEVAAAEPVAEPVAPPAHEPTTGSEWLL
jgi:hypothetical protein